MAHNDDEEPQLQPADLQNPDAILRARQQAERALAAERERLRITLASIGDAVISTDAEGRVTYLNGVAETLTGWTQPPTLATVRDPYGLSFAADSRNKRRDGIDVSHPS